jgi:pimeloyl-ACP methyl ester carboxylesterase
VPLLFVHGVGHGAWCWDEHFLDFFANHGYQALALSLRAHGNSPSSKPLRSCSLADYVDDVASVGDSLPARPVVIGHSLGGFVVQKYLEMHDSPAGVLVASFPARGSLGLSLRRMKSLPWLTAKSAVTGKLLPTLNTPQLAREAFFSAQTPELAVVRCVERLQEESPKAMAETMFRRAKPELVDAPVLALGADCDFGITPNQLRATARAYRTEAEFFPNMGHDMMLEPGWPAVAERIHTWLGEHGL